MGNESSSTSRIGVDARMGGRQSPSSSDWYGCQRERERRLLILLQEDEWKPIEQLLANKKYFPLANQVLDSEHQIEVANEEEMNHDTATMIGPNQHLMTTTHSNHTFLFHFHSNELDPALCTNKEAATELTCPICVRLYQSPVLFPCSHHFCRSCLASLPSPSEPNPNLRSCPVFQKTREVCEGYRKRGGVSNDYQGVFQLHQAKPADDIKQRVEAIEISCPYQYLGCPATMTIGLDSHNLFQHLLHECEYQKGSCNACGKVLNRKQRLEHECLVKPPSTTATSPTTSTATTPTASSSSSSNPTNNLAFESHVLRLLPLSTNQLRQLPINRFCLRDCGFTILHQAVAFASPKLIRCLLEHGALPNSKTRRVLSGSDEMERMEGFYYYRPRAKLANLAKPIPYEQISTDVYSDQMKRNLIPPLKSRELGFTPLMLAVIFARDELVCEICELLIMGGADVNATTTNYQWTAGLLAAQRGLPALWSLLLDHGVNRHHRNTDVGQDAVEVARVWGHTDDREMIPLEDERRRIFRMVTQQVLGDQFRMAEVCIQICFEYIGIQRLPPGGCSSWSPDSNIRSSIVRDHPKFE